jgi:hypothetical protein
MSASRTDSGGATTEFRVIDTSGATASAFTTDRNELRDLIEQMSPKSGAVQFPKVDATGSQVYFVSDGVTLHSTPPNVRLTAFEIRSIPSTPQAYEAYLEVQNFGRPAEVGIVLSGTGGQRINKSVRLGTEEIYKDVFDLSKFGGGGVRAAIQTKDDALPLDDVAFGYLPVKRKTRTLLVTRGNRFVFSRRC